MSVGAGVGLVGDKVGDLVGVDDGDAVGDDDGASVGPAEGAIVGSVGATVGVELGVADGDTVDGALVGEDEGAVDGDCVGVVGDSEGAADGVAVGDNVGAADGAAVGASVVLQISQMYRRMFIQSELSNGVIPKAAVTLRDVVPCCTQKSFKGAPLLGLKNSGSPGYHRLSISTRSAPTNVLDGLS